MKFILPWPPQKKILQFLKKTDASFSPFMKTSVCLGLCAQFRALTWRFLWQFACPKLFYEQRKFHFSQPQKRKKTFVVFIRSDFFSKVLCEKENNGLSSSEKRRRRCCWMWFNYLARSRRRRRLKFGCRNGSCKQGEEVRIDRDASALGKLDYDCRIPRCVSPLKKWNQATSIIIHLTLHFKRISDQRLSLRK